MEAPLMKKAAAASALFTLIVFICIAVVQYTRGGLAAVCFLPVTAMAGSPEAVSQIEYDEPAIAIDKEEYLCVPLPKGIGEAQLQLADHFVKQQLDIFIQSTDKEFFESGNLKGNTGQVTEVIKKYNDSAVKLTLQLDGLYEHSSVIEGGALYIRFDRPRELYDKVIVIDPGYGGDMSGTEAYGQQEKNIALDIALRLEEMLKETDIHAYLTRTTDSNPAVEERVRLADEAGASLLLSIQANADAKTRITSGTGIAYNGVSYSKSLSNDRLAKTMLKEMIDTVGSKNRGVYQQEEEALLARSDLPAMIVEVGYLTNKQEALRLSESDYRQKLAEGLFQGILKAFELMK